MSLSLPFPRRMASQGLSDLRHPHSHWPDVWPGPWETTAIPLSSLSVLMSPLEWVSTFVCALSHILLEDTVNE